MPKKETKEEKVIKYIEKRDVLFTGGKSYHLNSDSEKKENALVWYEYIKELCKKRKIKKIESFENYINRHNYIFKKGVENEKRCLMKYTNAQLDLALQVLTVFGNKKFGEVQSIAIDMFNISRQTDNEILKPYLDEKTGQG